jgi:hypothetical protein
MRSPIYWIENPSPGRLGIMARPRSGEWLDDANESSTVIAREAKQSRAKKHWIASSLCSSQ